MHIPYGIPQPTLQLIKTLWRLAKLFRMFLTKNGQDRAFLMSVLECPFKVEELLSGRQGSSVISRQARVDCSSSRPQECFETAEGWDKMPWDRNKGRTAQVSTDHKAHDDFGSSNFVFVCVVVIDYVGDGGGTVVFYFYFYFLFLFFIFLLTRGEVRKIKLPYGGGRGWKHSLDYPFHHTTLLLNILITSLYTCYN